MRLNFKRPVKTKMIMCRFTEDVHAEILKLSAKTKLSANEVIFVLVEGALDELKRNPKLLAQ